MIEEEVFKRKKINTEKLIPYGFTKDNNIYKYSKNILNNKFRCDITIENNKVTGKLYDLSFNDEYKNFRIESIKGEFVNSVKEEYIDLLKTIATYCCTEQTFIKDQTNRINKLIKKEYKDSPEFPWEDTSAVYRHQNNKKWYALIMNISKNKLENETSKDIVEVMNIKYDEAEILSLIEKPGYYRAYHMNKKKWITIILDDTLTDEEILSRIKRSYELTNK